jgi:4-amino-4-deoxy-L-arabinose transferase-like glycosyltransferase
VLLTYWAALAFGGRRAAFLAAALMAASVILAVEARLAKTDAMLLACSVAAMGALARVYLARDVARPSFGVVAIFWIALAAGILIKGPMVLLFVGLCGLVLSFREGSARWLLALRPVPGLAFTALVVAPWFIAIASKSGGEFYRLAVGDDMLGKVATGQQNHFAPPGFYLVAFFATFWPGAPLAAIAAPFAWANRQLDGVAFCLAWAVPSWLVFEAVPTKLPHYVMPLYPAIAILAVAAVSAGAVGPHRPGARLTALLLPLIPLGIALGLGYGAWTLDGALPLAALPVLAAAIGLAIWAWRQFAAGAVARSMVTGVAASLALTGAVFGLTQPVLQSLKLSPRLAELVRKAPCPDPLVATLGYREPSLVFLVGTGLDMVETGQEAVAFLRGEGCRVLLVTDRLARSFEDARAPADLAVSRVGEVRGFNINGGRRVTIDAYTARR